MSHNSYGLQVKFSHYPHMLYIASQNSTTLSCKLNWRHYVEILKGDAPLETGFYVILIKSYLCILFPKCVINAAFRKQNGIPYFLGQLIYATLCQCIILASSDAVWKPHWVSLSCKFQVEIGQKLSLAFTANAHFYDFSPGILIQKDSKIS